MNYLIKLLIQVIIYLIFPFGRVILLAVHDRALLKVTHVRFCYTSILLTLGAMVVVSCYTDFFPSILAPIISIVLCIKFTKPVYKKITRLRVD